MKRCHLGVAALILSIFGLCVQGASFKWAGMRNPCKISAEDGLNEKQLGRKIGKFMTLADENEWANAILNVSGRFLDAKPWVTWAVGDLKDATALPVDVHEKYLAHMDKLGVEVYIEIWPSGKPVPELIDTWLGKLKHHRCVAGLSVDMEYHRGRVSDELAKLWDEKVKSHNPNYRLMLKHWDAAYMPPTYRGKGDLIFVNDSSEASIDALNTEFAAWAKQFAPSAVAFQIGYPADEDGMDGSKDKGWWKLNDPIKDWGEALLAKIDTKDQEIGLIWVCAKSAKTYNTKWDLTRPAAMLKP
jgi:hypothetical protein